MGIRLLGDGIVAARLASMMTVFCIVLALAAAGFFTEIITASSAPFGYQDEAGFHFGQPSLTHPATCDIQNPS